MGREKQAKMSFMRKLARDKTANTLVISAAALVPIMAMVGGGVDASRYYMAAARMQAACDAGALAARRAMTNDTFTSEHRTIGLNFFDQNFNDGIFGVENRVRNFTSDGDGVVYGTASGRLPTSIMGAFGFEDFPIEVSCTAEINISNSDIMFVLDVTGSMSQCPNGTECNSNSSSKIVALRSWGKHFLIELPGFSVRIHLLMFGSFLVWAVLSFTKDASTSPDFVEAETVTSSGLDPKETYRFHIYRAGNEKTTRDEQTPVGTVKFATRVEVLEEAVVFVSGNKAVIQRNGGPWQLDATMPT